MYSREEAAKKIIESGLMLVERGLIARTWGNISARVSDMEFMITPSGMAYDKLTPEMIVTCKIEDCSYEGDIKPSGEKLAHAVAYQNRPDVDFIVHTHQLYGTVAGCVGRSLRGRTDEEKRILGYRVPVAKYAISATAPLGRNVGECIKKHPESNAIFMKAHGVLCMGKDAEEAFLVSKTLEKICRDLIRKNLFMSTASRVIPAEKLPEWSAVNLVDTIKQVTGKEHVAFDHSEVVLRCSLLGRTLAPIIDDMAQIGGVSFVSLDPLSEDFMLLAAEELLQKTVVFIKGYGAVIATETEDDIEAVSIVLEKNCMAELFAKAKGGAKHLTRPDAWFQRRNYVKNYSKLMK